MIIFESKEEIVCMSNTNSKWYPSSLIKLKNYLMKSKISGHDNQTRVFEWLGVDFKTWIQKTCVQEKLDHVFKATKYHTTRIVVL